MKTYILAGDKHTSRDIEVNMDTVKDVQAELNGQVSMLIKVCKIGKSWNHTSRVRETMLNNSLAVCPLYLMFKDHKSWSWALGTVPPTRPVAAGNAGMNIHISEIVSEVVEPLVSNIEGGLEIISTEDMLAWIDELNRKNESWTPSSWWEGVSEQEFESCGKCVGKVDYEYNDEKPELCECEDDQEDTLEKRETSVPEEPSITPVVRQKVRTTVKFMEERRKRKWIRDFGWVEGDMERMISSVDALPEDIQDYSIPFVIIGSDVESLYPSLDIDKVAKLVYEAILKSEMKWENIDFMEACRYIALNWSEEQCIKSSLRKVLPTRRGRTGVKPGVRGPWVQRGGTRNNGGSPE